MKGEFLISKRPEQVPGTFAYFLGGVEHSWESYIAGVKEETAPQ